MILVKRAVSGAALAVWLIGGAGCAQMHYQRTEYNQETGAVESVCSWTGWSCLMNDRMQKVSIDRVTKTTSQGLSIGEVSGEVDSESLEAIARGATEAALKAIVPVP